MEFEIVIDNVKTILTGTPDPDGNRRVTFRAAWAQGVTFVLTPDQVADLVTRLSE